MPIPRRKPFWRWAPLPYLVLILLMLATGTMQDARLRPAFDVLFWVTLAAAIAVAVWFLAGVVRGPRNPDASGMLRSLDGLVLLEAAPSDAHPVAVVETRRRQHAIDAALAFGDARTRAILVPHASSWWGLRYRTAVHLVAGERVWHAGELHHGASERWDAPLEALRVRRGAFVTVPAVIEDAARPFAVDLDLGGLDALVQAASSER